MQDLETNKRIARVWFDRVINNHDLGALDEFYPHDYIYHNEDGSVERGRGSAVMVATRLIESAPDGVATVHDRSPRATAWPPDGAASARNTGSPVFGREADGAEMRAWGLVLSGSRTVGWPKIGNWFGCFRRLMPAFGRELGV